MLSQFGDQIEKSLQSCDAPKLCKLPQNVRPHKKILRHWIDRNVQYQLRTSAQRSTRKTRMVTNGVITISQSIFVNTRSISYCNRAYARACARQFLTDTAFCLRCIKKIEDLQIFLGNAKTPQRSIQSWPAYDGATPSFNVA